MSHRLIYVLLFILITITTVLNGNANTDNTMDLSLEEAVALALQNNLGLKAEEYTLQEKKWALATVWNQFIPSINMQASLTKINDSIIDNNIKDLKKSAIYQTTDEQGQQDLLDSITKTAVSSSFNLSLNLNAAMIFDITNTVTEWKKGKISLQIAKKELIKQTKNHYYTIIILSENIKLHQFNLDAAKKRYALMQEKYNNNLVSELELLNVELNYENQKPALIRLKNQQKQAIDNLKHLLGLKEDITPELDTTIQILDKKDLLYRILNENSIENAPTIIYAKQQLKNLIHARNYNIALLTPSIGISFLIDPGYTKPDPFGKDSAWFENTSEDWRQNSGNFTFSVTIPVSALTPFSKEQMRIANTNMAIKKEELLIENQKKQLNLKLNKMHGQIEEFYTSRKGLTMSVELAKKVYTLTESSFNQGMKTLLEMEEAEKEVNKANLNLMQAKYDYILNIIELENLLNINLIQ